MLCLVRPSTPQRFAECEAEDRTLPLIPSDKIQPIATIATVSIRSIYALSEDPDDDIPGGEDLQWFLGIRDRAAKKNWLAQSDYIAKMEILLGTTGINAKLARFTTRQS